MINITEDEKKIVISIIEKCVPNAKVMVYGSRFRGTNSSSSDLDLAFDNQGQKLSLRLRAELEDAFSDSNLPYMVDVTDLNSISDDFKQKILENNEKLETQ